MASVIALLNVLVGVCLIGTGIFSESAWWWLWVVLGIAFFLVSIVSFVKIRRSSALVR